jgi:hypothetical protein
MDIAPSIVTTFCSSGAWHSNYLQDTPHYHNQHQAGPRKDHRAAITAMVAKEK